MEIYKVFIRVYGFNSTIFNIIQKPYSHHLFTFDLFQNHKKARKTLFYKFIPTNTKTNPGSQSNKPMQNLLCLQQPKILFYSFQQLLVASHLRRFEKKLHNLGNYRDSAGFVCFSRLVPLKKIECHLSFYTPGT